MKVSLNWLKDYVDIDMNISELAHMMTMAGLEVEGIEPIGHSLGGIVTAKILDIKKHPDADMLYVCQLDAGENEYQVVCSATNLKEGNLVPAAPPGTVLPNGIKVKETKIRRVRSSGMLLAEDEMGLTDDHSGIMVLPHDLEPGTPIDSITEFRDYSLEIGLTPNRPDCASIIGIAREIAALTGQKLILPEIKVQEGDKPIEDLVSIDIEDPLGCLRYAAGLILGVKLKPSPYNIRARLFASGLRGISNVVDVSNYVLLETGQPLHTFDYDRLRKNTIIVKRAKSNEVFTTLDGQSRLLDEKNLMICDGDGSVALAGIMGGLNSEIYEDTVNVLIESAYFDPVTIRRGSKKLGLSTDASYRFERGIDIEGVISALRRAEMMILDLAGGSACKGIIDNYPKPYSAPNVNLRIKKTNAFLGTDIPKDRIVSHLEALEMDVKNLDNDTIIVKPPSFRVDITREIDLVEEVARMEGYDRIPVTYPHIRPSDRKDIPWLNLRNNICDIMIGMGYSEVITYSFVSPDSLDLLWDKEKSMNTSPVQLKNPLSIEQSVLRTSLIPGIVATMAMNITYEEKDLKLFEFGKIYLKNDDKNKLPEEKLVLVGAISGLCNRKEWYNIERKVDFYEIKGAVEVLLQSLGLKEILFHRRNTGGYNPENSCGIYISDILLGHMGQLAKNILEKYEFKEEDIYLFEIDIQNLINILAQRIFKFKSFTKYPAVYRDISLIIEENVENAVIQKIVKKHGKGLIESVNLYDVYQGDKIESGKKALSYRISYRSSKGTLDGKEINKLHDSIINAIMKGTGGRLREG